MERALGAQHREVKQLRDLLRDRKEREAQRLFVIDGPRAVDGAFDRDAPVVHLYVGEDANDTAAAVTARAFEVGVPVSMIERGLAERISDTRTSAGVFALCRLERPTVEALDVGDLWIVLPSINDPGNLGTILRAASAAGTSGIALGAGSVDLYNPKVVRASAGAVFGVPVVQGEAVEMLARLGQRGVRRLVATAPRSDVATVPLDQVAFGAPTALVLGHETRGASPEAFAGVIDGAVTIPMVDSTESLNVAMAATVLMFEAARQRGYSPADANPNEGAK